MKLVLKLARTHRDVGRDKPMPITLGDIHNWLKKELNFFRVHLLFFLLVPLVSAAIFYGANGEFHIREYRWSLTITRSVFSV